MTDEHQNDEEQYLQLSGIQHYAFCPRQWGLMHLEAQWQENLLTFEGTAIHERVHTEQPVESRPGIVIARALPIVSRRLRLVGRADVVEFSYCGETSTPSSVRLQGHAGFWQPEPVEYKRGQPKKGNWDSVQVCSQAMCLEEMLGIAVPTGMLYYGRTHRRQVVQLDESLRQKVIQLAGEMHSALESGTTPSVPRPRRGCQRCSLANVCIPKLRRAKHVAGYVAHLLAPEQVLTDHA